MVLEGRKGGKKSYDYYILKKIIRKTYGYYKLPVSMKENRGYSCPYIMKERP